MMEAVDMTPNKAMQVRRMPAFLPSQLHVGELQKEIDSHLKTTLGQVHQQQHHTTT